MSQCGKCGHAHADHYAVVAKDDASGEYKALLICPTAVCTDAPMDEHAPESAPEPAADPAKE